VFDDTDSQGRIQLKSTQAASELNLGHLIHTADNYRGGLRVLGAEWHRDGYAAVRAATGLLVTSRKIPDGARGQRAARISRSKAGLLRCNVREDYEPRREERGLGSAADRLFWTSGRDCSECKAK